MLAKAKHFVSKRSPGKKAKDFEKAKDMEKELFQAIVDNNDDKLQELLQQGVNPNLRLKEVISPHKEFAKNKSFQNEGQGVDENDTPLHIALRIDPPNIKIIHHLLTAGANPNQGNSKQILPAHIALSGKQWQAADVLLATTNNSWFQNAFSNTAFQRNKMQGGLDIIFHSLPQPEGLHETVKEAPSVPESIIKFLTEEWGENINQKGGQHHQGGESVLEAAQKAKCDSATIERLMKYGATPRSQQDQLIEGSEKLREDNPSSSVRKAQVIEEKTPSASTARVSPEETEILPRTRSSSRRSEPGSDEVIPLLEKSGSFRFFNQQKSDSRPSTPKAISPPPSIELSARAPTPTNPNINNN